MVDVGQRCNAGEYTLENINWCMPKSIERIRMEKKGNKLQNEQDSVKINKANNVFNAISYNDGHHARNR